MKIEFLQKKDEKKWDEFVLNSEKASYCHLLGWRNVIKKSYGHQDFYLVAKEREKIKGILPAFIIKHLLFGKRIISLPFSNYGGMVAEKKTAQNFLFNYLKNYTKENKYDCFELRNLFSSDLMLALDLSNVTAVLDLKLPKETIWRRVSENHKRSIKKSKSFGLELKKGRKFLEDFYRLYQKSMKRLGTPVHSLSFFGNIFKEFPQADTFLVKFKDKSIAGLIVFPFKNILSCPWHASDNLFWELKPNHFLYWELIKWAKENKFQYLDFCRSHKESGTLRFKKQWGGEIRQLYYQHYLSGNKNLKSFSFRDRYNFFSKIWKKLPLSLTNIAGPFLRKYVP